MLRADSAQVNWDTHKKQWTVRVKVGEEVIRRSIPQTLQNVADDELKSLAVESAKEDGYEVDPAQVEVVH